MLFSRHKTEMIAADTALPGRDTRPFAGRDELVRQLRADVDSALRIVAPGQEQE